MMTNLTLSLLVLLVTLIPLGSSSAAVFEGPLQVKNQFPIFLPIDQPYLESASTESSFSISLSHSSVFVMADSAFWSAHLDMEVTELNFRYRKNIPGFFEVGVDLPILRAGGGFLDDPLAWYHHAFGFGDYGRNTRPKNAFLYEVRKNGAPLIEGENDRTGFGDARLSVKKKLAETDPVISIMADAELPTGNARIGYGSGSVDYKIALLVDKDLGPTSKLYANMGAGFPGDLKAYQTIRLDNFFFAGCGLESLIRPHLGLLAQVMAQTSPYPHTGISKIDNTGVILVIGGRYYRQNSGSYELSLTEDLNTSGAPDFILNLSYKLLF